MTDIEKWLRPEEWDDYVGLLGYASVHRALDVSGVKKLVESLARRAGLLSRAHSFLKWLNEQTAWQVQSPHRDIGTLIKEIAAELERLPRGG